MTTTARPATDLDLRTGRRLRAAGVAALAAAALGSVLGASPALGEAPSTDSHCRMDIVGGYWFSSGCADDRDARTAP
jgi:hypothetical protein